MIGLGAVGVANAFPRGQGDLRPITSGNIGKGDCMKKKTTTIKKRQILEASIEEALHKKLVLIAPKYQRRNVIFDTERMLVEEGPRMLEPAGRNPVDFGRVVVAKSISQAKL
jgi:hypothetical protein